MLQYLSASCIYPVSSAPLKNGVIALESDGTIRALYTAEKAVQMGIENISHYEGKLIPGLVNTHCHLELSHLFQRIPEHTGLQAFVQEVIKYRATPDAARIEAMEKADQQLFANGIVAVGDIANGIASKSVKENSTLYYHTFVETMGFNPEQAAAIMQRALGLKKDFAPLSASINPHAPYSVSSALFAEIKKYSESEGADNLISMHNQETADEDLFFEKKQGAFLALYQFLGLDISYFTASGKSALQTVLPQLPSGKVLLVHNTQTQAADLRFAKANHHQLFWCLCPNANLYIENQLPDVQLLRNAGLKITLGTDSLASNHQLSILSEMCTLQGHDEEGGAFIPFEELLTWATLNGAEFLGISHTYGSLEVGKKPGINLLNGMLGDKLTPETTITRLI